MNDTPTSRLEALWGAAGLARLQAATVMVVGAGGVGSNCIEALARGAIGTIVVVDGDEVAASNINRQAVAWTDTVGMRKVDAVRTLVERINPSTRVTARDAFLLPGDVAELIASCRADAGGRIDYIVDAIDTVSTKLELAACAQELDIPIVSSMGGAMKLYPELLRFADIYDTQGDALARVIRKCCRKRGIRRLDVLYSPETPLDPPQSVDAPGNAKTIDNESQCAESERPPLGTTSYLPPIMGQMLAGFVMRRIVGIDVGGDSR
ncbi:ThiF family adenylyltransferase [uncultured Enorma sp.]|uniref:tRNA threonylcarbamoyladenosine dehydratase n=1 Tax=uncultured Enorma sp. TaxID=1714346 RepID=UPI002803B0C2|nr:ThiF family adenylyltransferase [uncultured Enorma sp.]